MPLQSIIQQFHPARKFLFLIGLFLFFLAIASVAQVLIILPYTDFTSIKDLALLDDFSNPTIIKGLKIAQAVSAILAFIVPSLLFAYLVSPHLTPTLSDSPSRSAMAEQGKGEKQPIKITQRSASHF
jgi:hypothetical protein